MVEITQPKGFVPRSKGCDLPAQYAQKAENLNVFSGRFEAWREPELVVQFPYPVCRAHVSQSKVVNTGVKCFIITLN